MFADKLDYLMQLTATTNSQLAKAISLDPSYISRLRVGKRMLPRKRGVLAPITQYLCKRVQTEEQRVSVEENAGLKHWAPGTPKGEQALYDWLQQEPRDPGRNVALFLNSLSRLSSENAVSPPPQPVRPPSSSGLYYGESGKREAVHRFMMRAAAEDKPQTLLLFSDESMSWFFGDPVFCAEITQLMFSLLRKGDTIKIVHSVVRDGDEMLGGIVQWLPLYMTGAVESYYCPQLEQSPLFRRTLFVAPRSGAVCSTSLQASSEDAVCLLVTEAAAICAMTAEFEQFLSLCKPLMYSYTSHNAADFWKAWLDVREKPGRAIHAPGNLSMITLPASVAQSISQRLGNDLLVKAQSQAESALHREITQNHLLDLAVLPPLDAIREGRVPVPLADLLGDPGLCYTCGEFCAHLRNILSLLERYPEYDVNMQKESTAAGYTMFGKEGAGILVVKATMPSLVFSFNEPHLTAAFWDYLVRRAGRKNRRNRLRAMAAIRSVLAALEPGTNGQE